MSRIHRVLVLALFMAALAVSLAHAQGVYDLTWWTVDGGGDTSSGGEYVLSGTAGQPEAGRLMQGGDYTLAGGFWEAAAVAAPQHFLYVPLVMRGN